MQPDGYFYALNLTDGTTAWKTEIDTQDLFSFNTSFDNEVQTSIWIDLENQRLFWELNVKNSAPSSNYTGTLCNLDLINGNVTWIKQLEKEGANFGGRTKSLAFNNNTEKLFLAKNNGLWIFNASTGDLVQHQQFDHYILPPIAFGNETFLAADLWLFAYA